MLYLKSASCVFAVALAAMALCGCGATGGGDQVDPAVEPPPPNLELTVLSDDSLDGYIRRTGLFSYNVYPASDVLVGDMWGSYGEMRGYLSFDLSALVGKTIVSATAMSPQ